MKPNTAVTDLIERVISSGLFSAEDEEYFTWDGCDYCCPAVGCTVSDVEGYTDLNAAQSDPEGNLYGFRLCSDCLNKLYYGENRHESL